MKLSDAFFITKYGEKFRINPKNAYWSAILIINSSIKIGISINNATFSYWCTVRPRLIRIQSSQLMLNAFVCHQPLSSPTFIIHFNSVVHSELLTHVRVELFLKRSPSTFFMRLLSTYQRSPICFPILSINQIISLWRNIVRGSLLSWIPASAFCDVIFFIIVLIFDALGEFLAWRH